MGSGSFLPVLLLAAAIVLQADVTLRYSMNMTPGTALPPNAAEQLHKQMKSFEGVNELQIKNNRARASGMGATSITDFDKGTITLIDDSKKRYATASQKQFLEVMGAHTPKPGDGQTGADAMKLESTSKKTGRTSEIRGIKAEETEVILSAKIANTPFEMRTVFSLWSPAAGETDRHPSLMEIAAYSKRAWAGSDITATLRSVVGLMPGGQGMGNFLEAMKDISVLLDMKATMSMPGMAEMLRQLKPEGETQPAGAGEVMFTMTQKLEELSTTEVGESRFIVPPDYVASDLKELMGQMLPGAQAPAQ